MAVELITQAEYARRRGVAKSAVAKAVAENRITLIDGKIDPAVADVQWAANTRPRVGQAQSAGGPAGAPAAAGARPAAADAADQDMGADDSEILASASYTEATRRLKVEEARIARMERLERERKLTDADAVGRAIWTAFRTLRDSAMPMGRRVAGRVAAMSDAREIQLLIDAELRLVLNTFRDRILSRVAVDHAAPAQVQPPADCGTDSMVA